jgi:NAD(P)-dependent dehydrogenase (short-subunit alcohol dehydrogenase family)
LEERKSSLREALAEAHMRSDLKVCSTLRVEGCQCRRQRCQQGSCRQSRCFYHQRYLSATCQAWTSHSCVSAGGKAVTNTSSVADGAAVIKTAIDAFGGVSILINNAGILRCVSRVVRVALFPLTWSIGDCTETRGKYTKTIDSRRLNQLIRLYLSFKNISDKEWDMVQLVHLKGAFSCTKAAWPYFRKQRFGRVINTASAAGLYGTHAYANIVEC